jgi:hypothetical protein
MRALAQWRIAGLAAKALPVEVEAFGTDPLHHVDALPTGVTLICGLWRWLMDRPLGNTARERGIK